MAERDLTERLDQMLETLAAGGEGSFEPELANIAEIASRLRSLPDPNFRLRLRQQLEAAGSHRRSMMMAATATYMRPGFHSITPYLILENADGFARFAKEAYGAEELLRVPGREGRIMHAEIRIGNSIVEFADASQEHPPSPTSLHLYVADCDAVYRRAVAAGANSLGEPVDQPYGDREAAVKDTFGNVWYIATHKAGPPDQYAPQGLYSITPFLHPESSTEMIRFLREAFKAEEGDVHQSPAGAVAHATVRMGDSLLEMSDAHDQWQPMPTSIQLYVSDVDQVYARALSAGAESLAAPEDKPYGERMAGITDPFGNRWFLACALSGSTSSES